MRTADPHPPSTFLSDPLKPAQHREVLEVCGALPWLPKRATQVEISRKNANETRGIAQPRFNLKGGVAAPNFDRLASRVQLAWPPSRSRRWTGAVAPGPTQDL